MTEERDSVARRAMVSGMSLGALALGVLSGSAAQAQSAGAQPARHPEDNWMDRPNAKHRLVIDSTIINGGGSALAFAGNFITANGAGYKLSPSDLAIVVVFRHFSTPIAYNDAMWAKYGNTFSAPSKFTDPKTNQPPKSNLFNAMGYGLSLTNFGQTIDGLAKQGVQFAVCDMATHFFAAQIAGQTKGNADAIYREIVANLIPNAHLAAAGIVAVNRAQERGYTFAFAA